MYVLSDSGTVKSEEIKIRDNTGGQYFVVEAGLKPGNKIILEGVATLREGAAVKPVEVNTDSLYKQMLQ